MGDNGHTIIQPGDLRPKPLRFRMIDLAVPGDFADVLHAAHRDLVADGIRTGHPAPDYNEFLVMLLRFGYESVMRTPEPPAATPPTEAA